MCGIAGILTINSDQDNLETLIHRMQNALQHRGPDDRGIYISIDRQVALAHTRLAILDLSPSGHQPMSSPNGRYWITFNGEIYNFRELRRTFEAQGEKFDSQTDTEVILKLYQTVGANCVKHLRGMFAFAIWDDLEKTCFLARDPLGIKPLYYWQSGSTLIFASELRAILSSNLPTVSLSKEGLYGYLVSGSVPEPHTLIEGIHCLEAGNCLEWQAGNLTQSQYWQINFGYENVSLLEAAEQVRSALIDSIKYHFVSDVPVGVFLSGGIDSTAVVALARKVQSGKLRTYSIAFEEPDWNEGEIAKRVADTFETEHTEYKITAALGRELFSKFLTAIDQPTIDGFNTFCVSYITRNHGTKVALSGLGGDELFGGYSSFQKIPKMVDWGKKINILGAMSNNLGASLERWGKSVQLKRLGDFLQQPANSVTAYRSFRGIFSHGEACAIATNYFPSDAPLKRYYNSTCLPDFTSIEDQISFLELSQYMRNQLLRDSDVMSMASSLELRVPLVDQVLFETIATISSKVRLTPGKQLLIHAVPELPNWVVNRRKQGFAFPFEQWLATEWHDLFNQIEFNPNIPLTSWYRRWSLVILKHWWEQISG